MQTILVPLDGSPLAEHILGYVRHLASGQKVRLHLLNVISTVDIESLITSSLLPRDETSTRSIPHQQLAHQAEEMLRENAELYLTSQAAVLRAAGLDVHTEVSTGAPHECIVEIAGREPDTVIALTTNGFGGFRRWVRGSVTERVIQTSTGPIFIVPSVVSPVHPRVFQRILVPLDGSEFSHQALPVALELASGVGAKVILMQAVVPVTESPGVLLVQRNQAAQELQAMARDLDPQLVTAPAVMVGNPAEAIIDAAATHEVDVIVMATHGRGGLQRWALGSVADTVLRMSTAPILLVRPWSSEN